MWPSCRLTRHATDLLLRGLECVLSNKSADKARKLGYSNVKTFVEGYPEWSGCMVKPPRRPLPQRCAGSQGCSQHRGRQGKRHHLGCLLRAHHEESPDSLLLVDVRDAKNSTRRHQGAINMPIGEVGRRSTPCPRQAHRLSVWHGARAGSL